MATQSNGINQRARTKTAPSFPRERQQQQHQPQPQPQTYFLPQQQYLPTPADFESWRSQHLQSVPLVPHSRRSSRGPRPGSPIDPQTKAFNWDQSSPYSSQRNQFRRKSITSNTSSSDHHALLRSPHPSRSPSPGTPRTSLSSRTIRSQESNKRVPTRKMTGQSNGTANPTGCRFETALVNSRRRIPYSVGSESLAVVPPGSYLAKLDEKDDRCLSVDIQDLYHSLLPTEDTEERRRAFLDKLSRILRHEFPKCFSEVHVFGSSENRLGTNSSDVDICVVTTTKDMDDTCMLASVLHENNFEKVVCVAAAKVPVVKIWDAELNIQCDINVNNSLAIENTRLVKLYVDIDERVRPLAMIIKYWAKSRLLNDAAGGGTLTSYTWILMVIYFLQTRDPPILPSLQKLPHRQRLSNGIDVGFFDDIAALKDHGPKNVETLGALLYAFFVKFAFEFNYAQEVISVRTGGTLSKEAKGWHLMQNNSLCVEEPFNTTRNLGNTADEATVKGLQLEFRRAVHYLADHASLELACWPYQFPTSDNPRPERHLPNIPPQFRQTTGSNNFKKPRYARPQNTSPPFKSPKSRAQDIGHHRNFNSFSASRHAYPFNPLNLNPTLPSQVPLPATPQSGISSNLSPAGDIHQAYPPTPVDQLHYIDPFKNRQVAYYIPAFAPNGLPVYVPYAEDPVVYASPPQTPAMSETSLSHQPQYPRPGQYGFPQQHSRGQSVQRGRTPHREDDVGSPNAGFPESQPLSGIGMNSSGISSVSPPYIPPPMKRRNSLPPNNKPNVPVRPSKSSTASYTPSTSSTSQVLPGSGSMSSVGGSDVFEEDFYEHPYCGEMQDSGQKPRPHVEQKTESTRSPTQAKEMPPIAGKSYAAALAAPAKSPSLTSVAVRKDSLISPTLVAEKDKRKVKGVKPPAISLDAPTSPGKNSERDEGPISRSASPVDNLRKGSTTTTVWTNGLHPSISSIDSMPTSPVSQARRASIQSISSNSPKKPARLAPPTKQEPRKTGALEVTDVEPAPSTTSTTKSRRKRKQPKKKDGNAIVASVTTPAAVPNRRQSITASA